MDAILGKSGDDNTGLSGAQPGQPVAKTANNIDGKTTPPATGAVQPAGTAVAAKPSFDEWYKTVPSDRNDMSSYNLRRAYELAPWEELEAWRTSAPEDLESGKNHLMTAYINPSTGDYEFMKSKNHPTINKELEWYNSPEAEDFRKQYSLDTSGDYYKYVRRKQNTDDSTPAGQNQTGTSTVVQDGEVNAADFNKFEEESLARNRPEMEDREKRKKLERQYTKGYEAAYGEEGGLTQEDIDKGYKNILDNEAKLHRVVREGQLKKSGEMGQPKIRKVARKDGKGAQPMPNDMVYAEGKRPAGTNVSRDILDAGWTPGAVQDVDPEDVNLDDKSLYQFVEAKQRGSAGKPDKSPYEEALDEERELDRQRKLTYEEMMSGLDREMEKINLETPEEKKKREKRERARRVIAAIGDGISALSNLYFTTKGGPNMYEKNTLSDRTRASIERLKAEREADQARHLQLSAKKYGLIDDLLKEKRTARKLQMELQLKAEKAEKDAMLAEARARLYESQGSNYAALAERQNAQALKAQAEAARAQAQAEWVPKVQSAQVNKLNQQAGAASASANLLRTRAAHVGSGGGGGGGRGSGGRGKPYTEWGGKTYQSQAEYERDVYDQADQYGVDRYDRDVTTDLITGEKKERKTAKKTSVVAAQVDRARAAKQRQQQQQRQRQQPARGATAKPQGTGPYSNFSIHGKK